MKLPVWSQTLISRVDQGLVRVWSVVLVAALIVMSSCTLLQVVMRLGWAHAWPPLVDLIAYSFTFATFSGAALLFRGRHHLAIGFVLDRLQGRSKRVADAVSDGLALMICLYLAYLSIRMFENGTGQFSPTMGISMGWVYWVVPLSLFSGAFFIAVTGFGRHVPQEPHTAERQEIE